MAQRQWPLAKAHQGEERVGADASIASDLREASAAAARGSRGLRRGPSWLWSGALLLVLTFLVIYPVAMLLLGALTDTNPVVDGFGVFNISLANFTAVVANPNEHAALLNSLIVCGGGTALAVVIGLTFCGWWCAPTRPARASSPPPACCRFSCCRWWPPSPGRSWPRRAPASSTR
jgi:ABC-type Fe3+ transport system permease subunit